MIHVVKGSFTIDYESRCAGFSSGFARGLESRRGFREQRAEHRYRIDDGITVEHFGKKEF